MKDMRKINSRENNLHMAVRKSNTDLLLLWPVACLSFFEAVHSSRLSAIMQAIRSAINDNLYTWY